MQEQIESNDIEMEKLRTEIGEKTEKIVLMQNDLKRQKLLLDDTVKCKTSNFQALVLNEEHLRNY